MYEPVPAMAPAAANPGNNKISAAIAAQRVRKCRLFTLSSKLALLTKPTRACAVIRGGVRIPVEPKATTTPDPFQAQIAWCSQYRAERNMFKNAYRRHARNIAEGNRFYR